MIDNPSSTWYIKHIDIFKKYVRIGTHQPNRETKMETKTDFNRYTQGFKYFGPLEQCNDGEYMLVKDHEKIVSQMILLDKHNELIGLKTDLIEYYKKSRSDWMDLYYSTQKMANWVPPLLTYSIFGTLFVTLTVLKLLYDKI
jgi:hypothetical protein